MPITVSSASGISVALTLAYLEHSSVLFVVITKVNQFALYTNASPHPSLSVSLDLACYLMYITVTIILLCASSAIVLVSI